MNELLKLEDIEKLMDDTREAAEYQNVRRARFRSDRSRILSRCLGSVQSASGWFISSR